MTCYQSDLTPQRLQCFNVVSFRNGHGEGKKGLPLHPHIVMRAADQKKNDLFYNVSMSSILPFSRRY